MFREFPNDLGRVRPMFSIGSKNPSSEVNHYAQLDRGLRTRGIPVSGTEAVSDEMNYLLLREVPLKGFRVAMIE